MKKKSKGRILLYVAIVLGFLTSVASVFGIIALNTNLLGLTDVFSDYLVSSGYAITEVTEEIMVLSVQFSIVALIDLLSSIKYLRIVTYRAPFNKTPFSLVIVQVLFGSFITAIIAYIGFMMIEKNKITISKEALNNPDFMNNYRMEAMTEAITRLKELKEKGAISEEEYYETLNKILES